MTRSCLLLLTFVFALALAAPSAAMAGFGDVDPTFGSGGVARRGSTPSVPNSAMPVAVRMLPDGRILIATGVWFGPSGSSLIRLTRSGELDSTFAGDEARTAAMNLASISDVEPLGDGRLALLTNGGYGAQETRLTILHEDGTPDQSFGTAGTLRFGVGTSGFRSHSIAVQDGSKILMSGYRDGSKTTTSLIRVNLSGSVDDTFGEDGVVNVSGNSWGFGEYPSEMSVSTPVTVAPDGHIYLGIDFVDGGNYSCVSGVAKLSSDGAIDTSYGLGGVARVQLMNYCYGGALTTITAATDGTVGLAGVVHGCGGKGGCYTLRSTSIVSADGAAHRDWDNAGLVATGTVFATGATETIRALRFAGSADVSFGDNGITQPLVRKCGQWGALDADADGAVVAAAYDCDRLTLVRLRGRSGGTAAPRVLINDPPKRIYRRRSSTRGLLVAGFAAPADELARVEVAIRRVSSRRCTWVTEAGAGSVSWKKRNGVCDSPVFMRASGKAAWSVRLRKSLVPGQYLLYMRATTKDGVRTPFTTAPETYARFRVSAAKRR